MAKKKKKKKKGLSFNNVFFMGHACPLKSSGIHQVHHADVRLLKYFLTEKGKIMPRRITGICSAMQSELASAIKRARNLALLSFAEGYVPQEHEEERKRTATSPVRDVPSLSIDPGDAAETGKSRDQAEEENAASEEKA